MADASGLGPGVRKDVGVQVSPLALVVEAIRRVVEAALFAFSLLGFLRLATQFAPLPARGVGRGLALCELRNNPGTEGIQ